jgi:hypothetical protein
LALAHFGDIDGPGGGGSRDRRCAFHPRFQIRNGHLLAVDRKAEIGRYGQLLRAALIADNELVPIDAIISKLRTLTSLVVVCAKGGPAAANPNASITMTSDSHPVFILIAHLLSVAERYSLTTAVPVNTAD